MNLNEIELPAFVLANLYPNSLVEENKTGTAPVIKNPVSTTQAPKGNEVVNFLGNNRRQIMVLVDYPSVPHLPDPDLELLTGILTACKLSLDDIALVNRNNDRGSTYKNYQKTLKSKIVLLFDTAPESIGLPMSFPFFQPQTFSGTIYLYSPSLNEMGNDKLLKSKLWVCLKKIFHL